MLGIALCGVEVQLAKRSREIGKSITETVLAFANEPRLGGGHLLLGVDSRVDEKGDTRYWPEGLAEIAVQMGVPRLAAGSSLAQLLMEPCCG